MSSTSKYSPRETRSSAKKKRTGIQTTPSQLETAPPTRTVDTRSSAKRPSFTARGTSSLRTSAKKAGLIDKTKKSVGAAANVHAKEENPASLLPTAGDAIGTPLKIDPVDMTTPPPHEKNPATKTPSSHEEETDHKMSALNFADPPVDKVADDSQDSLGDKTKKSSGAGTNVHAKENPSSLLPTAGDAVDEEGRKLADNPVEMTTPPHEQKPASKTPSTHEENETEHKMSSVASAGRPADNFSDDSQDSLGDKTKKSSGVTSNVPEKKENPPSLLPPKCNAVGTSLNVDEEAMTTPPHEKNPGTKTPSSDKEETEQKMSSADLSEDDLSDDSQDSLDADLEELFDDEEDDESPEAIGEWTCANPKGGHKNSMNETRCGKCGLRPRMLVTSWAGTNIVHVDPRRICGVCTTVKEETPDAECAFCTSEDAVNRLVEQQMALRTRRNENEEPAIANRGFVSPLPQAAIAPVENVEPPTIVAPPQPGGLVYVPPTQAAIAPVENEGPRVACSLPQTGTLKRSAGDDEYPRPTKKRRLT